MVKIRHHVSLFVQKLSLFGQSEEKLSLFGQKLSLFGQSEK